MTKVEFSILDEVKANGSDGRDYAWSDSKWAEVE